VDPSSCQQAVTQTYNEELPNNIRCKQSHSKYQHPMATAAPSLVSLQATHNLYNNSETGPPISLRTIQPERQLTSILLHSTSLPPLPIGTTADLSITESYHRLKASNENMDDFIPKTVSCLT